MRRTCKPWTQSDLEALAALRGDGHKYVVIARRLGRTREAVRAMARALGIGPCRRPRGQAPACRPPCRHCGLRPASRARQLCWVCSADLAVRDLYPSSNPWNERGNDFCGPAAPPVARTDAPPGSPEKQAVLTERAGRRLSLFHRADGPQDLR